MIGGKKYYGKYRGKVADNVDPLFLGRILPIVPAVSEEPLTWATPCVPYAGKGVGFFAVPLTPEDLAAQPVAAIMAGAGTGAGTGAESSGAS